MSPRISMITLGVKNLNNSIHFYKQLGFPKFGEDSEEVAFFNLNGTWLGLYGREDLAKDAQVPSEGSGFNNFSLVHNVSSEDKVDEVINHAVAVGASLKKKPQKVFWGGYAGYFSDPDGHLWEVAYNPFIWIGPKEK